MQKKLLLGSVLSAILGSSLLPGLRGSQGGDQFLDGIGETALVARYVLGGNAEVHGMVVAEGWGNLHGTRAVDYNQNVIDNLQRPMTLSEKHVPNTWRERQPTPAL